MAEVRPIRLSYVLTTRNKLEYLQQLLPRLIAHASPDEEIVVVDGASTDGSVDYLEKLHREGGIHQLLSEPDVCQAHGANRGLLLARGELIKILLDDDPVHLPGIRACRDYMLAHPEIGVLNGNTAHLYAHRPEQVTRRSEQQEHFLEWRRGELRGFWFGDQSLFLRRSMLPLIGLWHTGVVCLDVELSFRITSLRQVPLAWYTGYLSCAILNERSTTFRPGHLERNTRDVRRVYRFYLPEDPEPSRLLTAWRGIRDLVWPGEGLRRIGRRLRGRSEPPDAPAVAEVSHSIAELYAIADRWLEEEAKRTPGEFLHPSPRAGH